MRSAVVTGLLLVLATASGAQTPSTDPDSARIVTADIERFWQAYDRLGPRSTREDSVRAFVEAYLAPASPGLEAFDRIRLRSPDGLLFGLKMLPRYYAAVRANTLRLHEQEPVLRAGFRRLQLLYPEATFPDVYFVVGGFSTQGTLSDAGLLIGAEMVSADASTPMDELPPFMRDVTLTTDVIPCIVVHELVHHQQENAEDRSLLAQSLVEGVADFVTDRAMGCYPTAAATYAWGDAHEQDLWAEFQRRWVGPTTAGGSTTGVRGASARTTSGTGWGTRSRNRIREGGRQTASRLRPTPHPRLPRPLGGERLPGARWGVAMQPPLR